MRIHDTAFDLVSAQCETDREPCSLPEALGLAQMQLHALAAELSLPTDEQDAESLLQQLVTLGAVAVAAASRHVLPVLEKEDA